MRHRTHKKAALMAAFFMPERLIRHDDRLSLSIVPMQVFAPQ